MHDIIFPTYATWKAARTALAGTTYVVTYDRHYIGIVIDSSLERWEVYCTEVVRFSDDSNLADFVANVLPGSTAVSTIEDAITLELT